MVERLAWLGGGVPTRKNLVTFLLLTVIAEWWTMTVSDGGPPGVMWPEEGSGFDPSFYSPAGQLKRDSMIAANWRRDPRGLWKAFRTLVLAIVAVLIVVFLIAVIAAAVG